jgi:uncharacterized membrane protein (DUF373 family)
MSSPKFPRPEAREWIALAFTAVEDVVYIGLGLILAASAFTLLVTSVINFVHSFAAGQPGAIIFLLDRILLILLIVELLYTVQVSFREHALLPEPFLLIGLISAIRRVLVLTAEFGEFRESAPDSIQHFLLELGVLTALILALAISLVLLRKKGAPVVAERAGVTPAPPPAEKGREQSIQPVEREGHPP